MAIFIPHGISLMFSFVFSDVHGHVFIGFYWSAWLLISWASLVFTSILVFNSVGVHGCALMGFINVSSHYSNLVSLVFLVIIFLGF
jgi:hypothetical protein